MPVESLIAVDIGNTRVHFARFENFRADEVTPPVSTFSYSTYSSDIQGLRNWLTDATLPWYTVSVHRSALASLEAFSKMEPRVSSFVAFNHQKLPIEIAIPSPEKIGLDRLAAAVAANHMRQKDRPAIVVDAGTAITIDVVSDAGEFVGGAILPGMQTSAKALAARTDALPQITINLENRPAAIGTNTSEAMQSGLFWGSVGAVRETIRRVSDQLNSDKRPQIFFSGGDVNYLAPWMDLDIETVDHLVMRGVALAAQSL
ncbi:type III pantothenate kinase [Bremerella sp. P1]|uniref:type III pantothenate kinase n=1 Tax=Bremerella sp. P1 TaxID=3026424 RepID=UPI002368999A|nr:type III pantothenate kinase [Bremerella sp. P1]WDI44265.1 type III pantothenate kinase [Bremerella sp. P1]